jgi:hypothetical protein
MCTVSTVVVTTSTPNSALRAVQAVLAAGLVCGTLDGASALLVSGANWLRLFQFIASGVLGTDSFKGGVKTALLGIALHYSIAFGATMVYYGASRVLPLLLQRALPLGVLNGVCVHLFMNFVVIPLSAIGSRPFSLRPFAIYLVIHMVVVGPSIALTLRGMLR